MHELMKKTTLILCGLAMVIGSSLLAPAMEKISAEYPAAPAALLPLVITLPALTLLVGLVTSSALSARLPIKTLILTGLILILIGGVLPYFLHSLYVIIALRGILGVGLGMIMPLQTALFAEYEEAPRTVLIGANVTVNCVFGVLLFAAAGKLAEIDWRLIFLLYAIFALILVLAIIYIPQRPLTTGPNASSAPSSAPSRRLPASVYVYCLIIALVTLTGYVMTTIMANYLTSHQLGGAAEVGILTALATAVSAIGGMVVPLMTKYLRNYATPILILLCGLGFFCYTLTASLGFIALGHGLTGFAQGVLGCVLTFKLTQAVALEQVSLASSCYLATLFVSQFLSPYWLMLHKNVLHLSGDTAAYTIYALGMTILAVFAFFWMRREDRGLAAESK